MQIGHGILEYKYLCHYGAHCTHNLCSLMYKSQLELGNNIIDQLENNNSVLGDVKVQTSFFLQSNYSRDLEKA